MHVVIDIAEMVAELAQNLPKEEAFGKVFSAISTPDGVVILGSIAREVVRNLAGYHDYSGIDATRALVTRIATLPWNDPDQADAILDEAFAEVFDNYRQELTRQLRPHIAKKALWLIEDHGGKKGTILELTYVGDGKLLEVIATSAGLDFKAIVDEVYPTE